MIPRITRCMIDIETLATTVDSVILSIGAVNIDNFYDSFYVEVETEVGQEGRRTEKSALDFWEKHKEIMPKGKHLLYDSVRAFRFWYLARPGRRFDEVWCQGTDFDIAILKHVFDSFDLLTPWKYSAVRDLRTIRKFLQLTVPESIKNECAHNALADAKFQANVLKEILKVVHGRPF